MKPRSMAMGILVAIGLAVLFVWVGPRDERNVVRPKRTPPPPPKRVADLPAVFVSLPESPAARRTFVRTHMLTLLQHSRDPRPLIQEALQSSNDHVRWAGMMVFDYYGTADRGIAERIADSLAPERLPELQLDAAKAAGRVAPEDFILVEPGLRALAGAGTPPLTSDDLQNQARRAAVATLTSRAVEDTKSLAWLATLFDDPDPAVRESGAYGFSQFEFGERLQRNDVVPYVPLLRGALKDDVASVRSYALMALGRMGGAAASAVPDMAACIHDEDVLVRRTCLTALGGIGAAAVPALMNGLSTCSDEHVGSFMHALYMIGDEADAALKQASTGKRAIVRVHALIKRWERRGDVNEVLDDLTQELAAPLTTASAVAVLQAARGLGRMGKAAKTALPALRRAYTGTETALSSDAARELTREDIQRVQRAIDAAINLIDR